MTNKTKNILNIKDNDKVIQQDAYILSRPTFSPLRHARRQKMSARRNFHVGCSMSVISGMGRLRQRKFMILASSSGYMKKWRC